MALIAMAVFDTEENNRTKLTEATLKSLLRTVDFNKHRLFIIDNNSCQRTKELYKNFDCINNVFVIGNKENVGTAKAINQAWRLRADGEHCIKMDNDVVIHYKGWVEEMEEAIARDPSLGQVGLKRKDCWEYPSHPEREWRSEIIMLPHQPGERWIFVERSKHIIGTCVMHSSSLIDRVGGLFQPGLYGYDDVLMSWRSSIAGFKNVFLPHINIDHIDATDNGQYQGWKERHSGQYTQEVSHIVDRYLAGTQSTYYAL